MANSRYTHLRADERETLSLGLAQGQSLRTMAAILGCAPSTLSREVARNTARGRPYRASTAQTVATGRARHPRRPRKLLVPWLWAYVQPHLRRGCSPEQIAGRLRREYPGDRGKHVSTEPIYAALYVLPAAPCGAPCWPRCGRRAKPVGPGRGAPTAGGGSPT